MQAAAHTKGGFGGVPQKVGKEFVKADKGMKGGGLYENIHAKRERIAAGSGERMRKPGSKGAPTAGDFKAAAKTAKMKNGGDPVLAVSRGEKLPTSQGAGLTQKGRDKFNKATGSNLKAPQAKGPRHDSFCARMSGMPGPMKDDKGQPTRKAASLERWHCATGGAIKKFEDGGPVIPVREKSAAEKINTRLRDENDSRESSQNSTKSPLSLHGEIAKDSYGGVGGGGRATYAKPLSKDANMQAWVEGGGYKPEGKDYKGQVTNTGAKVEWQFKRKGGAIKKFANSKNW
jgi:hypothetical protein